MTLVGTAPVRAAGKRAERNALIVVVSVAVLVRLLVVWRVNARDPNSSTRLYGDESGYDYLAIGLLDGRWFDYPLRLPLYPSFMTLVHALSDRNYDAVLYLQALLGASTVILTWLLARRLFSRSVGLIAAAITAVHYGLVLDATRFLTENLYTPALLGFLVLFYRGLDEKRWTRFALAGAALGVANLIRPTAAALPLALAIGLVLMLGNRRRSLRWAAVLTATSVLTITPWLIHNVITYDTFLPLTTSNGQIWQGSPEYYDLYRDGRSYLSIWDLELNADRNGGHRPDLVEGDRYFTQRGLDSIRDRPLVYLEYDGLKAAWFWIGQPDADWYGGGTFSPTGLHRYWPWWEVVWILGSRLLPLIAAVSFLGLRSAWRRLWPITAVLTFFTVLHALTWSELRLSGPLTPLLAIIVAAAVAPSVLRFRRREAALAPDEAALVDVPT